MIAQVCGRVLSQGAAAERLGICVRQVKRLKDRDLQCTKVKSSPRPSPAEDEKTVDARLDAVLAARCNDSPTAETARAWTTGGLTAHGESASPARYPPALNQSAKGDIPIVRSQGTFLLCVDTRRHGTESRLTLISFAGFRGGNRYSSWLIFFVF